jgi:hypothetical protein
MNPTEFCYWLQGYSEIGGGKPPTVQGWQEIRNHLNLVMGLVSPHSKDYCAATINGWEPPKDCLTTQENQPFRGSAFTNSLSGLKC